MLNADEARLFFQKAKSGLCSHAYIVDGAAGIGKLDFALDCARAMLCENADKPCGYCDSCRKALSGDHPDIHIVGRDKTAAISDIRELARKASLKPNDSDKQIFIVCNAGKLREDSQNALLKLFEEPPATVAIFLLTESRSSLLPTVLSRGQRIHLDGMRVSELEQALSVRHPELSERELRELADTAQGNLGNAEKSLSKESVANRKKAENLLALALGRKNFDLTSALLTPKFKREQLSAILGEFVTLVCEAEKYRYGIETARVPLTGDCAERIGSASRKALAQMGEAATVCMHALDNNANVTSSASKLAIELLVAATK